MQPIIILASSSPYRKALLARLNINPLCIVPDIDETPLPDETAAQTAQRLAHEKAQAVIPKYIAQGGAIDQPLIIIGSDQVLLHQAQKLGKPGTHENAVAQLQKLSGEKVTFFTALTMLYYPNLENLDLNLNLNLECKDDGSIFSQSIYHACDQSHVQYRTLNLEMIQAYLKQEPAYDCAGSTKSEGLGLSLIQSIKNDDPSALIGLPLIKVCDGLAAFNYCVLRQMIVC